MVGINEDFVIVTNKEIIETNASDAIKTMA